MAAFIKSLSRLLSAAKPAPQLHLAAFGKHPGWNDHTDDLGLDTDALVNAKRLLYVQGISQNIDSGAWDKIDAAPASREISVPAPASVVSAATDSVSATNAATTETLASTESPATPSPTVVSAGRLELFRHDFLWHMPQPTPILLAGRLWSSSDGKGRDKYPMVLCSQLSDLSAQFAARVVLPFLAQVQERCVAATTANTVREIIDSERENLRARAGESTPPQPLSPKELLAIADHPDLPPNREGFLRIVYQFASGGGGMSILPSRSRCKNAPLAAPSRSVSPPAAFRPRRPSSSGSVPCFLNIPRPLHAHVCCSRPTSARRSLKVDLIAQANLPRATSSASRPARKPSPSPPTFPTRSIPPSSGPSNQSTCYCLTPTPPRKMPPFLRGPFNAHREGFADRLLKDVAGPWQRTASPTVLTDAEYYGMVRGQIEFESGLIAQRFNWFVASQSFFFTAFAITLNGIASPAATAAIADQQRLVNHLIPVVALAKITAS